MYQERLIAPTSDVFAVLDAQKQPLGPDHDHPRTSKAAPKQRCPEDVLNDWAVLTILAGAAVGCLGAVIVGAYGISLLVN